LTLAAGYAGSQNNGTSRFFGFLRDDKSLLIGPEQAWMNTKAFLDRLDTNLKKAMG